MAPGYKSVACALDTAVDASLSAGVCDLCPGAGVRGPAALGLLPEKGRRAEGGTLPLRRCAHSRQGGGRSATAGCSHIATDTNTATAAGLRPRRSAGGRGPSDSAQCPPRRRPGRMLQMVKTLAQFTIALEEMRDLGPAAASGESAGGGGSDTTEEPGEAQVPGGGWAAGNLGLGLVCQPTQDTGEAWADAGEQGLELGSGTRSLPACLSANLGLGEG